ncbi:AAA family ATPase [Microvirga sp. P5_D2]
MIRDVTISNVRTFAGRNWTFPLKSLTAFCGTNSAGKSTVLKALLLLKQNTVGAEVSPEHLARVEFVGRYVDLGDFRSLVTGNDVKKPIIIGLSYDSAWSKNNLNTIGSFVSKAKFAKLKKLTADHEGIPGLVKVRFEFRHYSTQPKKATKQEDVAGIGVMYQATFEVSVLGIHILSFTIGMTQPGEEDLLAGKPFSDHVPHFVAMPSRFFDAFGGRKVIEPVQTYGENIAFGLLMRGILPTSIVGKDLESKAVRKSQYSPATAVLPPMMNKIISDLRNELTRVEYIGPLRAPARRYYMLDRADALSADVIGESVPYILRDQLSKRIRACLPNAPQTPVNTTLKSALNAWVSYLKLSEVSKEHEPKEISAEYHRGVIGEVRLRGIGRKAFSLADTGFGFSQILPILVKGLTAPRHSIIMIEQPELHLHPALQVRLASFFVSLVYADRSVLIETHSEHLINSLRVLAAEDLEHQLASKIKIFFLSCVNERPCITDLTVREDGTVPEWPREFFGEAGELTGRLLRAQKAKRTQGALPEASAQ